MKTFLIACVWLTATESSPFTIQKVTPANGETGVDLDPLIQIHTSEKFDPKTVKSAVSLMSASGKPLAIKLTPDLGGVITVSLAKPLELNQQYTLKVNRALKSSKGVSLVPFTSSFRTTPKWTPPKQLAPKHFRFVKQRIGQRDGVCGLTLAPGGNLFACTWGGQLVRYRLDVKGNLLSVPEVVLSRKNRRFLSLVCDPNSEAEPITLWLSHDSLAEESLGPNDFSGTISRITIQNEDTHVEDFIVGLPTGDHPATGLTFGPGGKLFVSQGALTMLGEKPTLKETPLSAAVLEIDLTDKAFQQNRRPLDVQSDYDPNLGPVKRFATGIREAYDLCWHSNGSLYAGVNMNDTNEKTPKSDGVPSVNVRPAEMMIRIVRGKYYGHPNPSRGEWVLLGGNPTKYVDPWEVPELPIGTQPDPRFDPSLLIRNLERDKGPSADGCVEWTGTGPLQGRLLFCFYTATRGIHTYQFSPDGRKVLDHQPLLNEKGEPLRFGAPLDVVFDPAGRLYVADFSSPKRGDSGKGGGVWMASPLPRSTDP